MSTEEDTFNTLRRLPIKDMCVLVSTLSFSSLTAMMTETEYTEMRYELLKNNGWTTADYNKEMELLYERARNHD